MTTQEKRGARDPAQALDKTYDPAGAEARWAERWEESGALACGDRKSVV